MVLQVACIIHVRAFTTSIRLLLKSFMQELEGQNRWACRSFEPSGLRIVHISRGTAVVFVWLSRWNVVREARADQKSVLFRSSEIIKSSLERDLRMKLPGPFFSNKNAIMYCVHTWIGACSSIGHVERSDTQEFLRCSWRRHHFLETSGHRKVGSAHCTPKRSLSQLVRRQLTSIRSVERW